MHIISNLLIWGVHPIYYLTPMPSRTHQAQQEAASEDPPVTIATAIGSAAFKGVLAVIGLVVLALLTMGFNGIMREAASKNDVVVSTKADVDTLKVAVSVLSKTADSHTDQLTQIANDRVHSTDVQEKIFTAIKQLSTDIHAIDVHVATVDQKVEDLKEQRQ